MSVVITYGDITVDGIKSRYLEYTELDSEGSYVTGWTSVCVGELFSFKNDYCREAYCYTCNGSLGTQYWEEYSSAKRNALNLFGVEWDPTIRF